MTTGGLTFFEDYVRWREGPHSAEEQIGWARNEYVLGQIELNELEHKVETILAEGQGLARVADSATIGNATPSDS